MKIKASPCLFNQKICLEAVSSGKEVDAINVGGQIPDIYRRLDRRDASRAGDKRSTHQPVVTDVTATIGNTGFRVYGAFLLVLAKKVTFYRSSTASVVGAGIAVSTVVVGETVT